MDWAFPLRTRITKRALHVCGEKKREKIEKEAKEAKRRESETFKHQNCLQVLPNLLLPELQKK